MKVLDFIAKEAGYFMIFAVASAAVLLTLDEQAKKAGAVHENR